MRGYQFHSNDGFYPNVGGNADINGIYVDGYSITMVILDNTFGLMLVVWNNTYNLGFFLIHAPVIKDKQMRHIVHLLLLVMIIIVSLVFQLVKAGLEFFMLMIHRGMVNIASVMKCLVVLILTCHGSLNLLE